MTELDSAAVEIRHTEIYLGRDLLLNDVTEFVNALTDPSGPRDPELDNESLERLIAFGNFMQGAGMVALAYRDKLIEAKTEYSQNITEVIGTMSLLAANDEISPSVENLSDTQSEVDINACEDEKVRSDIADQPIIESGNDDEHVNTDSLADEGENLFPEQGQVDVESTTEEVLLSGEELYILRRMTEAELGSEVDKSYFEGFENIEDRASKGAYQQAFSMAIKELTKLGLLSRPSRLTYSLNRENPQLNELISRFLGQ